MGWFSDQWQGFVKGLFSNDYVRDYTHAARTFQTNGYQNAPKFKFLFHVVFDINENTNVPFRPEYSLLVKDIKLPSFKFDVKELNQYNRKRLVQTKINYEPVTITFHDDNGNLINKLWYNYFTYYYADAQNVPNPLETAGRGTGYGSTGGIDSNGAQQQLRNTYQGDLPLGFNNWGYIGETQEPGSPNPKKPPFFNNITIFGFNQHNFTAYTLINPVIVDFAHDTYSYDESQSTMKNTMTLNYETVLYNEGYIDGTAPDEIVQGFGTREFYDRQLSPLLKPGTNASVLGQGGLLDSLGGVFGGGSGFGGLLRSGINAGSLYYTFKDVNLKDLLLREIEADFLLNSRQNPNPYRNTNFNFPRYGGQSPNPYSSAGAPTSGAATSLPTDQNPRLEVQVPGSPATVVYAYDEAPPAGRMTVEPINIEPPFRTDF